MRFRLRSRQIAATCAVVAMLSAGGPRASTCSSTCPPPHEDKTCTVTCSGSSCISACWDGKCYGDCTGSSFPGDGNVGNLQKLVTIQLHNLDLAGLVTLYEQRSGLTIQIDFGLESTVLDGTWCGVAEEVFDTILGEHSLEKTVVNSSTWRVRIPA